MKLTSAQRRVLEALGDGEWHDTAYIRVPLVLSTVLDLVTRGLVEYRAGADSGPVFLRISGLGATSLRMDMEEVRP